MKKISLISILALYLLIIGCSGFVSGNQAIGGDTGYYSITSQPGDADVHFDGKYQGTTPITIDVPTTGTPGHTVSVSKSGYQTWTQTLGGNPQSGQTISVFADLTPSPVTIPTTPIGGDQGYFNIQSVPSGAEVRFDGQYKGETPVTVSVFVTGTPGHSISISYPGYQTWTQSYARNPGPGETIYVQANLIPSQASGSIYVTSVPSGAQATLDNSDTQTTPCSFSSIPVGSHSLQVYTSGYQPYYTTVNVQSGQTTTINAYLNPSQAYGNLQVSSSPSGADIYIDGNYYGHTPRTVGNLVPGSHSVLLRLAGYQDWTGMVSIVAGSTTTISPSLSQNPSPQYGYIQVSSTPSNAAIYLDGTYQGRTISGDTFDISNVVPGSHVIQLSLSGYEDYTSTITISAGQTVLVNAALSRNPVSPTTGSIEVISAPSGAEVYVDNVYRGYTPMTVQNIAPGSHVVLLQLGGYNNWQSTVTVNAGQTTSVSATFVEAPTPTSTPTKAAAFPFVVLSALVLLGVFLKRKYS